jgi:DivIVA domain-containing protein
MAILSIKQIESQKFATHKLKEGYDLDEVDDFLDDVVETVKALSKGQVLPKDADTANKIDKLNQTIQVLTDENAKLLQENLRLQNQSNPNDTASIQKLNSDIVEKENALQNAEKEKQALQAQIEGLSSQVQEITNSTVSKDVQAQLEAQADAFKLKISEYQKANEDLIKSNQEVSDKFNDLLQAKGSTDSTSVELQNQFARTKEELVNTQDLLTKKVAAFNELENEKNDLEHKVIELNDTLGTTSKEVVDSKNKIGELSTELTNAKGAVEQLTNTKSNLEAKIADLETQVTNLSSNSSETENILTEQKQKYDALQSELSEANDTVKSKESEIEKYNVKLDELNNANSELAKQYEELMNDLSTKEQTLKNENDKLKNNIEVVNNAVEELQVKLESETQAKEKVQENSKNKDVEISKLQESLKTLSEKISDLETQYKELKSENEELANKNIADDPQFIDIMSKYNSILEHANGLEGELENLKSAKEAEVASLTEQLNNLTESGANEAAALQEQLAKLNEAKNNEIAALNEALEKEKTSVGGVLIDPENPEDSIGPVVRAARREYLEIKAQADEYAANTKSGAEEYSNNVRIEADEYATGIKNDADVYWTEQHSKGDNEYKETVETARNDATEIIKTANEKATQVKEELNVIIDKKNSEIEDLKEFERAYKDRLNKVREDMGSLFDSAGE